MEAEFAEREEKMRADVEQLRSVDRQVAEAAPVIPEDVATNMIERMVPFVGIPIGLAGSSFVGFWYLAKFKDMVFPTILVASVTVGFLVVGLLGITYSLMSTNWDESSNSSSGSSSSSSSVLGVEEFNKNLDSIKEGLRRSRDNVKLRDEMNRSDNLEGTESVKLEELNRRRRRDLEKEKRR